MEFSIAELVNPVISIMGGIAGMTLIYFFIVVVQNRKKQQTLDRIEARTVRIERYARDVWMDKIRGR